MTLSYHDLMVSLLFFLLYLQIMAVYRPHHIDVERSGQMDGNSVGINIRKFAPRDPCETKISTLKPSGSTCTSNSADV